MSGLLSIVFLCLLINSAAAGEPDVAKIDDVLIQKFMNEFELDPANYKIEQLDHNLNRTDTRLEQLTVHPLTQKKPQGPYTVIVKVWERGKVVEQSQVRMRIRKFAEVLVAADRISSRSIIAGDMVAIQRMDVTNLREKPVLSHLALTGFRAKRNIAIGKIITTASIELIPDVERGREVKILVTAGACKISAEGIALQRGIIGEYVKVKNKSSGKILVARVTGKNAVAVDP